MCPVEYASYTSISNDRSRRNLAFCVKPWNTYIRHDSSRGISVFLIEEQPCLPEKVGYICRTSSILFVEVVVEMRGSVKCPIFPT